MDNIVNIPLGMIDANPYQPREAEDAEHVQHLANSIAVDGLLQIPTARRINGRVQLAFGHSRLAAYKLLNEKGARGFDSMPLNVVELDDEGMFRQAIRENVDRKDLSAIERARAMAVYRDQFKKNSEEIGALFGVADSTVRGALRLLELPEEVQKQVSGKPISEGVLRDLLVLFSLPEMLRAGLEQHYEESTRPSCIVRDALNGSPADVIRERLTRAISGYSRDLCEAPWKHEEEILFDNMQSPTCQGCPMRITREKKVLCIDKECYDLKYRAWKAGYLAQASLLSGLPVIEGGQEFWLWTAERRKQFDTIRASGCENLGITYERNRSNKDEPNNLTSLGFPHAAIQCRKRQGMCTCLRALEHGIQITNQPKETEQASDPDQPRVKDTPAAATGPTADDLREYERQIKRAKRQALEEVRGMAEEVIRQFAMGLAGGNPVVWSRLLRKLTYKDSSKLTSVIDLRLAVAEEIVEYIYSNETDPDPEQARIKFNAALKEAGLLELAGGVSTETVKEPEPAAVAEAAPAGKSLVEVFADDPAQMVSEPVEGQREGETLVAWMERTGQLEDVAEVENG